MTATMDRAGSSDDPLHEASREVADAAEALVDCWTRAGQNTPPRLSALQVRALLAVRRCPGVNLSRLADMVGVSVPAGSRLCDRLEAAGFLRRERAATDRREIGLFLTRDGGDSLHLLSELRAADLRAVLQRMSNEEREALLAGLRAYTRAAHPPDGDTADR
ncbi:MULTISPECIES: MarR family winged helix-turn-helix transcriptional regulator [unclassified Streptomyces]|uniref:MarR family winged helix-turn-helix transcriptional regulator n=1 Tax=unclassified Streptomyces TaxID=2593676 RepID=UPI002E2FED11|nr:MULTISPECIES: MarR family transcriptional regulator [unclassified Streptomyces]WUC63025.1 MarR family transcriptional regulator [Streptomyces sp. NBC_00539]